MNHRSGIPQLAVIAPLLGFALHAYIVLFESDGGFNLWLAGLLLWSWLPYAVCLALARIGKRPLHGLLGAVAALVLDACLYYSVFVAPKGSTAALGLLFAPLVNLCVSVPVGVLAAFVIERIAGGPRAPARPA